MSRTWTVRNGLGETMKRALIGAVFTALSFSQASAMTGNELLNTCDAFLRDLRILGNDQITYMPAGKDCWTFLDAVHELVFLYDSKGNRYLPVCVPTKVPLTQLIRVFVEHAKRNTGRLHESGGRIAVRSWNEAFPCP